MSDSHVEEIIPRDSFGFDFLFDGKPYDFAKLSISYEPSERYELEKGVVQVDPEAAVLRFTGCCPSNYEHVLLNKEQAYKLALWLIKFTEGEYDK